MVIIWRCRSRIGSSALPGKSLVFWCVSLSCAFLMHLRLIYGIHVVQGKVILRCMGITRPRDIGWRLLWIWKSKTGGYDAMMRMICGTADIWNAFVWQVYEYYGEWLGLLGHWLSSIICVSGVCLKQKRPIFSKKTLHVVLIATLVAELAEWKICVFVRPKISCVIGFSWIRERIQ
jgi:hypothetical protein